MFQRLISITPTTIADEIDSILSILPMYIDLHIKAIPERKETMIQEIIQKFLMSEDLGAKSDTSTTRRPVHSLGQYVKRDRIQVLVWYTLLRTMESLDVDIFEPTSTLDQTVALVR